MKKLFFLTYLIIINYQLANAQSNYLPGYVINLKGDTLTGLIKKQSGSKNCREVIFKENKVSAMTSFTPSDLKSYSIDGMGSFISKEIKYRKTNKSPDKIIDETKENLSNKNIQYIETTAFIFILVRGTANLYLYIDPELHPFYFIQKGNGEIQELYQTKKYATFTYGGLERDAYRVEKNYIGILKILFSDCFEIMDQIDKTELNENSLSGITEAYNRCVAPENESPGNHLVSKDKIMEISLLAGINLSRYYFKSSEKYFNYLTKPDPPRSINYNMGINLNFYYPNYSKKISLRTGIYYYSIKYEFQYTETPSVAMTYHYNSHLENSYLKIPFMINYNLGSHRLKPYLFLGTPVNIVLKSKNTLTLIRDLYSGSTTEQRQLFGPPNAQQPNDSYSRNYELLGFTGGAGIKYINDRGLGCLLELKYEKSTSITTSVTLASKVESIYLSLGMIF